MNSREILHSRRRFVSAEVCVGWRVETRGKQSPGNEVRTMGRTDDQWNGAGNKYGARFEVRTSDYVPADDWLYGRRVDYAPTPLCS